MTSHYIAISCSKMFEDSSARKVRVYSARFFEGDNHPYFIAEQSTPQYNRVMVAPHDDLELVEYSKHVTDVVYSVGSTLI